MLDLLLSFISFMVISIKAFVSRFVFRPPEPSAYKVIDEQKSPMTIAFLRNKKYEPINFSSVDYEYIQIPDDNNTFIPAIIIRPFGHFRVCIIYSHGNSADIGSSFLECVDLALHTNCCVVSFEYPGYGLCRNRPLTEENVYYNIIKAYEFSKDILHFNPNKILLYGFSLGTGISFDLAARKEYPIAGLILHAPFLSIIRTMYNIRLTKFFDFFPSVDKASKITAPVLIIHGDKDSIVPYIHGKILAKKIPSDYMFEFFTVKGANHNNAFKTNRDIIYKKIRQFISYCTHVNFNEIYEQSSDGNSEQMRQLQQQQQQQVHQQQQSINGSGNGSGSGSSNNNGDDNIDKPKLQRKKTDTEENRLNDINLDIEIIDSSEKQTLDK